MTTPRKPPENPPKTENPASNTLENHGSTVVNLHEARHTFRLPMLRPGLAALQSYLAEIDRPPSVAGDALHVTARRAATVMFDIAANHAARSADDLADLGDDVVELALETLRLANAIDGLDLEAALERRVYLEAEVARAEGRRPPAPDWLAEEAEPEAPEPKPEEPPAVERRAYLVEGLALELLRSLAPAPHGKARAPMTEAELAVLDQLEALGLVARFREDRDDRELSGRTHYGEAFLETLDAIARIDPAPVSPRRVGGLAVHMLRQVAGFGADGYPRRLLEGNRLEAVVALFELGLVATHEERRTAGDAVDPRRFRVTGAGREFLALLHHMETHGRTPAATDEAPQ